MRRKFSFVTLLIGVVFLGASIELGPTTAPESVERGIFFILGLAGLVLLIVGVILFLPYPNAVNSSRIPKP